MSNTMSLKAKIRNIAKQKNIPAQVILQNYMFERLLVRLAASAYKDKFVLKGGMLVAAIVGLDNRATMDLDTTLKNLPLTPEAIRSALVQVAAVPFDDYVEKSDVLDYAQQPVTVTPARIRRMESRSIHTANGIEVKIPTELLNEESEVEFLHDADGSVSLLIKNVIL